MTNNTIPNVPRELKPCPFCGDSDLLGFEPSNEGGWTIVRCRRCGASGSTGRSTSEWEAAAYWNRRAPSPAGVDGLKRYEVFPYLDDEVAEIDICESDDGSFVKYDAAQAIIDGLRGEVADLRSMLATVSKAGLRVRTERDQQAQRIGELKGLLLASAELIKHGVFEDGICCCGASVDSHGFGDGHSPVDALAYHAGHVCERIDAALSACKDSAS